MSGHNKWSKIKRKKEIIDAKKGKIFGKLAKNIELAAQKGSDPQTNTGLKIIIDQAKSFNMPNINIERAIKKGSGQDKSTAILKEKWYEAYGPGGIAILIKTVTDNRNRTVAEIKHILSKSSASLAEEGSVSYLFNQKAVLRFPKEELIKNKIEELAIELNAEDISENEEEIIIFTNIQDLNRLKNSFISKNFSPNSADIEMIPENTINISEGDYIKLNKILDNLNENEDVQEVFTNESR